MEAKHTPGPWTIHSWPIKSKGINEWHVAGATPVATMARFDNAEANARLIASAPDLLAERDALRSENAALRAALDSLLHVFTDLPAARNYGDLVQQSRKALSKSRD